MRRVFSVSFQRCAVHGVLRVGGRSSRAHTLYPTVCDTQSTPEWNDRAGNTMQSHIVAMKFRKSSWIGRPKYRLEEASSPEGPFVRDLRNLCQELSWRRTLLKWVRAQLVPHQVSRVGVPNRADGFESVRAPRSATHNNTGLVFLHFRKTRSAQNPRYVGVHVARNHATPQLLKYWAVLVNDCIWASIIVVNVRYSCICYYENMRVCTCSRITTYHFCIQVSHRRHQTVYIETVWYSRTSIPDHESHHQ